MTSLVVGLIIVIGVFFIIRYAAGVLNAKITEYTETQPMTFPKVEMSTAELQLLKQRVAAFSAAMEAHSNAPPLTLSSRDLNALMLSNTNFKDLKDTVYVEITGDTIKGEVSLPLSKYFRGPFVHTKGRYLNGMGTFKVGVTNDMPAVYVQTLEVKGKTLPSQFMMQLQGKNMAEDFEKNPTNAANIGHYESIEVKDGSIVIKSKTE